MNKIPSGENSRALIAAISGAARLNSFPGVRHSHKYNGRYNPERQ